MADIKGTLNFSLSTIYQQSIIKLGNCYKYIDNNLLSSNKFDQILDRIFEDYSFWDFKEARKLVKKYKDSYKIYYEKLM